MTRAPGSIGPTSPAGPLAYQVAVRGHREDHDGTCAYVLDRRITGHDSFRPARLRLTGRPDDVRVRVLTLDDVSVVVPLPGEPELADRWDGTLHLPAGPRGPAMPADLAAALVAAGVDPDALPDTMRRHLVGFVAEARRGPTRDARLAAAVNAVRRDRATAATAR